MHSITVRHNHRLNPSPEQEAKLIEFASYHRGVWNLLLSETRRRHAYDGTFLFYREFAALLTELKKFEEFAWLKAFDSAAAQQVARDLDTALQNAIDPTRKQRFPVHKVSYRKKKLHNDSYRAVNNQDCIRIRDNTISLPKIGQVPIVHHRRLTSRITTATVQYRQGHWEVSLPQERRCKPPKAELNRINGYDINSEHTVVGSNGHAIKNPRSLRQNEEKLKQLQVQLSRRKQGSSGWQTTKDRLNRLHGIIARQRKDFAHQIAASIAKSSDLAVFETLSVKGMQQFNGRMVNDNVMGALPNLVKYKLVQEGGLFHRIGRFEKTTGICHACRHAHTLTLKQRSFTCEKCQTVQCRDWSAAVAIRRCGEKELLAAGTVARVIPTAHQKSTGQTKVLVRVL